MAFISNNYVNTSGDIGILVGGGSDSIVRANTITGPTGRGIYPYISNRTLIQDNLISDLASITGGCIQADDLDPIVDGNRITFSSPNPTAIAIRISTYNARSVSNNTFVNCHTTDPILLVGGNAILVRNNNSGGTANVAGTTFSQLVKTPYYTVANLPAALASSGGRAMVTDANATTFGSIVVGSGTNIVPVFSNGTNWIIG